MNAGYGAYPGAGFGPWPPWAYGGPFYAPRPFHRPWNYAHGRFGWPYSFYGFELGRPFADGGYPWPGYRGTAPWWPEYFGVTGGVFPAAA